MSCAVRAENEPAARLAFLAILAAFQLLLLKDKAKEFSIGSGNVFSERRISYESQRQTFC